MIEELTLSKKYIGSTVGMYYLILMVISIFVMFIAPILGYVLIGLGVFVIFVSIDSNFDKCEDYIVALEKRIQILEGKLENTENQ